MTALHCPLCDINTKPPVCRVTGCPIDGHILNEEIEQAVADINALVAPPNPPKEQFPFETLAHQAAEASIEAAQQALTKAQSFLEETKREAELHLEKIKARADALRDQISRQEKLGCSILDAHREFHTSMPTENFIPRCPPRIS